MVGDSRVGAAALPPLSAPPSCAGQRRVRVPCASSATLGNSTERVNGGLELHTHTSSIKTLFRPWEPLNRLSFWGGGGECSDTGA